MKKKRKKQDREGEYKEQDSEDGSKGIMKEVMTS